MVSESLDRIAILEGTDKSSVEHDYARHYEQAFRKFRDEPIDLLEIGVAKGASLRTWEKFFSRARLIGVDVIPGCLNCAGGRKIIEIGSQADTDFLRGLAEKYHPTIIIDDGSHQADHIRISIETLFPILQPGGCYVIEDLHFHHNAGDPNLPGGALKMVLDLAFATVRVRAGGDHGQEMRDYFVRTIDRVELVKRAAFIWKKVPDPDPVQTIATLKDLVERSGQAGNWFAFVNYLRDHGGSLEDAEMAARKAISLGDSSGLSHWRLSEVLESRGDLAGSLDAALQARTMDPGNTHIDPRIHRLRRLIGVP